MQNGKLVVGNRANEAPKLISLAEALRQAGLKKGDYYNKRKRNEFPVPVKTGSRQIRFVQAEVTAWIDDLINKRDLLMRKTT